MPHRLTAATDRPQLPSKAIRPLAFALVAIAPLAFALFARPLHAQTTPCSLVTPAEVQALLGAGIPAGTGNRASCRWGQVTKGHALIVLTYANLPPQAMAGMRSGMAQDGEAAMDEPTVGTGAASVLTSFGVVVIAPKAGRLVQLQYHVGHAGSTADRDAVRALAKSVVGRF